MRTKIINVAKLEVGYMESPPNSNKTKYGKWFGLDGVMWCAIFVSWVYSKAGKPLPNLGFTKGMAGCQTAVAQFKRLAKITTEPKPGDIVFYDWNGDGRYDHTGIFLEAIDNKRFKAIEGNTSLSNDSNGGSVMIRTRRFGTGVVFVNIID